jgi:glycosyltransferase involved in cell wall biosynthesis
VGSGPDERKLRQIADKYHVFDRIRWLGPVNDEDLISVYRKAQFVVLASHGTAFGELEGFGLPVLEAAACGKPAIVSNSGGLPEAVVDGTTGIVVSEPSPPSFANAILSLWNDHPLRDKMGEAARERAVRDFTWEAILQKLGRELRKQIHENQMLPEVEEDE